MANIPLQSISFPGLSDKYTTPTVDATLTQTGAAADAKKTGDEIGALKNDFTDLSEKVDSAFVTETATGSIASFTDGADDIPVKDLSVAIEPVQSGSGDPSPSNVRPISGWTGANVTRTGKNLLDVADETNIITVEASVALNAIIADIKWKPNTQYTLTVYSQALEEPSSSKIWYARFMYADGSIDGYGNAVINNNSKSSGQTMTRYTVTSQASKSVVGIAVNQGTGYNIAYKDMQLEVGSTATAYEPYQGETYEVDWTTEAGTVYGGTLDVTTGVLTVDRAVVDLGTLDWNKDTNRASVFYANVATKAEAKTGAYIDENWLICDTYKYINESVTTEQDKYVSDYPSYGGKIIFVRDTTYTESAEFNTGVSGHYVAYKLATLQTYQLTPQEVSTILGQNNIFADCGDVTAQYRADTKLYIDKVLSA